MMIQLLIKLQFNGITLYYVLNIILINIIKFQKLNIYYLYIFDLPQNLWSSL